MEKRFVVYIVESAASCCYTPILRHTLESMGLQVVTPEPCGHDMESIMGCIRQADAVLITGRPDTESAVVAGAAYALDRTVLHLCSTDDLFSGNVAAVSKVIYATDDVLAKLQAALQEDRRRIKKQ